MNCGSGVFITSNFLVAMLQYGTVVLYTFSATVNAIFVPFLVVLV